jgi:hypothetical protein
MILPEVIFEQVVKSGVREARKDKRIVYALFRNSPRKLVEEFHNSLLEHEILFTTEFPREQPELPMLWLNLIGEDEEDAFLGELMGAGHGADGFTLQDGYSYTYACPHPSMFLDSSQTGENSEPSELGGGPFPGDAEAAGPGVCPGYAENPEMRPIFGEPIRVYDVAPDVYGHKPMLESIGQTYRASYALTILGNGSTYVLFMYALIKSLLNRQRTFLEVNGVQNLSISGTDFTADMEFLPQHVMTRSLQLSFTYFTSSVREMDGVARGIDFGSDDPNDPCGAVEFLELGTDDVLDTVQLLNSDLDLVSIAPVEGAQGTSVVVVASGTSICNGATAVISGLGVNVVSSEYIDGNRLRFTVEIEATAALGARDVTVRNPDRNFSTLENGFTVIP